MKFLKIENSFLNIIEDSNDLERTLDKEKEFFSKEILEILFHESKNKLNDQKPYLFLSMKRDWTDFGMLDSMNCDSFFSILMQNAGLGFKKIARRVGV